MLKTVAVSGAGPNAGAALSSSVPQSNQSSLVTNTPSNVGSTPAKVTLTPGIWLVSGVVFFNQGGATTYLLAGLSTTGATVGANGTFNVLNAAFAAGAVYNTGFSTPVVRFDVSSNTDVYLIAQAGFPVNTVSVYGELNAVRIG